MERKQFDSHLWERPELLSHRKKALADICKSFNPNSDFNSFDYVWDRATVTLKHAAFVLAGKNYPQFFLDFKDVPSSVALSRFQKEKLEEAIKILAVDCLMGAALIDGLHNFHDGLMSSYAQNPAVAEVNIKREAL